MSRSAIPQDQKEKGIRSYGKTSSTVTPKTKAKSNLEENPTAKKTVKQKPSERLVVVNIKITEGQQEWLADTAKQVRQNNESPVPASDRVYPQHLIQVAIDLLKSSEVNWDEIRNTADLKAQLKLLES